MASSIRNVIAILAAVMIAAFALWEGAERIFFGGVPPEDLSLFYLVRGVSTAALMSILTAYLLIRYRRRYEEMLRDQSEESRRMRVFFENIVQDAGEAIVSIDNDDVIRSWNRAAESIYGYGADEIIGQSVRRLFPPDLLAAGEPERIAAAVRRDGCIRNLETRRIRKDGSAVTVLISRSVIRDIEGRIIGSSAIIRDVSAEKEMEQRLIQAEKLAAIGETAASIAHEVRNALAGISGTIEVLKTSPVWKELPEGVGAEVELQITRIEHIVNDLLAYARPGRLLTQPTDIHRLLDRVITAASSTPEASGKRVVRDFAPGPLQADADPGLLEQAFQNLITNAYQAMTAGGTLRVTTARSDGEVDVRFADTGCGMPVETKKHAFEPFFTTKARGTGLGLPIVKTIVEAHRGRVDLASSPGAGTTVTLRLPAATEGRREQTIMEEHRMHKSGKGVLVGIATAVFLALAAAGPASAADAQYVGAAKCKACHLNEHKVWMASKHATAIESLKPEERTKPECAGCHVTGFGKTAAAGADMNGVQCESCHGPGSLYKAVDVMNKAKYATDKAAAHAKSAELGLIIPDEKTCTSCHNSKSPHFKGFDFASAKEKIKHWK